MRIRYHVNYDFVVEACRFKTGKCPYGGSDKHNYSKEKEQEYVDEFLKMKFGILPVAATTNDW